MEINHSNDCCYLDQIRITEGADKCKDTLVELCNNDTQQAIDLLNDDRLTFPSLYLLHRPILQQHIQKYLNSRNRTVLQIVNQVRGAGDLDSDSPNDDMYPILKWILETGAAEEVPEDNYEEILDLTISLLINTYRDRDILPQVVDLIFRRNRGGSHIHDLVWALFHLHEPKVLMLIAQYLCSSDPRDIELAAELLNLDSTDMAAKHRDGWCESYLSWLEDNMPYLYFTEESFQYSSKPMFCCVDLERKYLQRAVPSHDKEPLPTLDSIENQSITAFKRLPQQSQKVLSNYSQRFHHENAQGWKAWLAQPIEEQMRAANARLEGKE